MNQKSLIRYLVLLAVFLLGCSTTENVHAFPTILGFAEQHQEIIEIDIPSHDPMNHFSTNPAAPVQIKDKKIITAILNMIEQSHLVTDESKFKQMSGMASKNNKMVLIAKDQSLKEIRYTYDDAISAIGYIEIDGQMYEAGYNLFRYMKDLTTYTNFDTNIDTQVIKLFSIYNWTVDYKISDCKEVLPANLKHAAGEYPVKIYWAYNNELSKGIGLDFSHYLGKTVDVEIYRLREPLPDYMKPYLDARGIVVKYEGKIVGAYIDAGRQNAFACSLNRKSLQNLTGQDWEQWIEKYIDYDDDLEVKLSETAPEDIVTLYYEAMDNHDVKMRLACMTRKRLCTYLAMNMNASDLYNKTFSDVFPDGEQNEASAKLIKLQEVNLKDDSKETITYQVSVDFIFKRCITEHSGLRGRFITLNKETAKSGWRIQEIGTGL